MNEKEQNLTKQLPLKQNWFTRATLGAAMADSPAVMTASGWRRNDNGDYVQDRFDDPATNRLADNLGVISSIAQAGPTLVDDATLLYLVVRHPLQTWRTLSTGVKEAVKQGYNYLSSYLDNLNIPGLSNKKVNLGDPEKYLLYHISRLGGLTAEILTPEEFAMKYWRQSGHPDPGQTEEQFIRELTDYMYSKGPVAQPIGNKTVVVVPKQKELIATHFSNNNLTPEALRNLIISHEIDHALNIPSTKDKFPLGFDVSTLSNKIQEYFLEGMGTELRARGSQIKDYFNTNKLTKNQLKYAAQNYIKDTGIDNQMSEFFNSVKDWKKAAKWLSKYSSGIALPIGLYKIDRDELSNGSNRN